MVFHYHGITFAGISIPYNLILTIPANGIDYPGYKMTIKREVGLIESETIGGYPLSTNCQIMDMLYRIVCSVDTHIT